MSTTNINSEETSVLKKIMYWAGGAATIYVIGWYALYGAVGIAASQYSSNIHDTAAEKLYSIRIQIAPPLADVDSLHVQKARFLFHRFKASPAYGSSQIIDEYANGLKEGNNAIEWENYGEMLFLKGYYRSSRRCFDVAAQCSDVNKPFESKAKSSLMDFLSQQCNTKLPDINTILKKREFIHQNFVQHPPLQQDLLKYLAYSLTSFSLNISRPTEGYEKRLRGYLVDLAKKCYEDAIRIDPLMSTTVTSFGIEEARAALGFPYAAEYCYLNLQNENNLNGEILRDLMALRTE